MLLKSPGFSRLGNLPWVNTKHLAASKRSPLRLSIGNSNASVLLASLRGMPLFTKANMSSGHSTLFWCGSERPMASCIGGWQRQMPGPKHSGMQAALAVPNTGRGSEASSSGPSMPSLANGRRHATLACHSSHWRPCSARQSQSKLTDAPVSRLRQHRCMSLAAVVDRDSALSSLLEGGDGASLEGTLVEYKKGQRTGLALITDRDGKRNWKAVDTRGTVHSLRPREISYVLPGSQYKEHDLQRIHEQAESSAQDSDIMRDVWELMRGEANSFLSVKEMADCLFNDTSPGHCYAGHRLLSEDRTFFKQVGRLPPKFVPRSELEVSTILNTKAAESKRAEQKLQLQEDRAAAFNAAITRPYAEKPTEHEWLAGPFSQEIRALQAYALTKQDPEAPFTIPEDLLDVMKPFTGGSLRASAACELLKQLGVWGLHEHLPLLQERLTEQFEPSIQAEAAALVDKPPPDVDAGSRIDLCHLRSFAVDSADTTEVDDAVSIQYLEDGTVKLWVHIADPTRWTALNTLLEKEAARRASTLYLPTGNVPMFPRQLSEQLFSFKEGRRSPALSIWMTMAEDGSLADCGTACSTVECTRLTYQELNEKLAEGSTDYQDLQELSKAAERRLQWRKGQGALTMQFPECNMVVSDLRSANPQITVKEDTVYETLAQTLVSELMIMANEAVGKIGAVHGLPLPYRGQAESAPLTQSELDTVPEGICRAMLIRSKLTRSVATVGSPMPHHSLGLAAYVQTTSPIRRYTDLLAHWQLKAFMRGEQPPLPPDPLSEIVTEASMRQRQHKLYDRDISRYWQTVFFQRELQANPHRQYQAVLAIWLRQESGWALAVLSQFSMTVKVWLAKPFPLGSKLQLLCSLADPYNSQLEFKEASSTSEEQNDNPDSGATDRADVSDDLEFIE